MKVLQFASKADKTAIKAAAIMNITTQYADNYSVWGA